MRSPPLIGFTPNDWASGWSSRRRILQGLAARGWPAFYSSGARSIWEMGSPVWRDAPWTHNVRTEGGLRYDMPGRLIARWPTRPLWDGLALSSYARHLTRALGEAASRPPVAMLFHPEFWPYIRHLQPCLVVYYPYDAHSLAPGWTQQLARQEEALVERADLIVAFARGVLDHLPGDGAVRGKVLPTGVDVGPFEAADASPCPSDLARIPVPRIGYVGRVNQKLDYALVLEIARQQPDWQWVFVGRVGAGADGRFAADGDAEAMWLQCRSLPNVHVLGVKPHEDIPRYLRHMDVNVMCYRTDPRGWWSEIFPLKSFEYLAAGRPIVTAPLKTMRAFGDDMAIASTPAEWIGAIGHAISAGGVGTMRSRRQRARENTWDHRIDRLHGWMLDALARRAV